MLAAGSPARAHVSIQGRVANETRAPVAGARLTLEPATGGPSSQQVSSVQGEFRFDSLAPGSYLLNVEREGYFAILRRVIQVTDAGAELDLRLDRVRENHESLEVSAAPPVIDMETTSARHGVTGTEIINVPFPSTNDLRTALRIVPGVLRDQKGGLHINGGAEDQVMYTLNGFNITDPLTGRFETRVGVESVQSVDISSGSLSAEYGKGSAGTLSVQTRSGDDKMRFSGTNFVPGIESRKGIYIGNWTPRFNVSGPLLRGRAWFSDSIDAQYVKTVVRDLPKGDDRISAWRGSNLLHTQVNLTPSNILYAGFLGSVWTAPRTGLSALDPIETTVDRRSRQWFLHIKDQIYLMRGAVIEFGFAANRTFGREIPQGEELYGLTPFGKRGNYFTDAVRKASRDQVLLSGFTPTVRGAGSHQIKGGIDLNRVGYRQSVRRTGYENYNEAGVRLRKTTFAGDGALSRSNFESSIFAQDSWRVRPGLLIEAGMRGDWDRILGRWDVSPRVGYAWSPGEWQSTRIYGGVARIFDASNLRLFSRPLDQYSVTYHYFPDGRLNRGPAVSLFTIRNPNLYRPRYYNWNAGVEQRIGSTIATRVEYLRRRGRRGFAYLNTLDPETPAPAEFAQQYNVPMFDAIYDLANERRDWYDSLSVTVRQNFRREYEWMASYTRSRALSNSVVDLNADEPLQVTNNTGRMPWDSPHRFIGWGYLPTFWKSWSVAYLIDARTGFPFTVQTDDGSSVGEINSHRFPTYFEANLHLERKFAFRRHRWAFRFGSNNLTNRRNPDIVNSVVTSSRYLQYFGGSNRSVNFRIRWLGRL